MKRHAFSLVELSIVLVILGLLVGGILAGRSLIRASELRSITADVDRYQAAIFAFRDKYHALAGDFSQATSFWGRADNGSTSGQCANTLTDSGTGTQTCNGNGDGMIPYTSHEMYRLWQHLSNAGIIEGRYSGVSGPGHATNDVVLGENQPAARIDGSGYLVMRHGDVNYYFLSHANHHLIYGSECNPSQFYTMCGILSGEEAWNIDRKRDDAHPAYGKQITLRGGGSSNSAPSCATTNDATTATYDLTAPIKRCVLLFNLGV